MPEYLLRQATSTDYDFLYQLHAATMREYVDATWGWQDAWQQEYFARKFDPESRQIIQIDGQDAGVIAIEQRDEELFIALIEIHPAFQGQGVGSTLLRHYIQTAHSRNLPITLQVLKANTPARRLYERLGFIVVEEEDYRFKMAFSLKDSRKQNGV